MIRVESIMSKNVVTISEKANISDAAKLMTKEGISCLVITKEERPVAIIDENDLVKVATSGKNMCKLKVKNLMHKNYKIIDPRTKFYKVEKFFHKDKIRRFLVVKNNELVGIITDTDIVNTIRDFTRFHQIIQEVILAIFGLATFFFLFYFSSFGQALFK
jgi:CBS domain-containing protein